jgi:hypothetical protein
MPIEAGRDHLGYRIRTLTECALHRKTLQLKCPLCQHERLLDSVPLWWMWRRSDDRLQIAMRRFYCRACRRDTGSIVRPRFEITDKTPVGSQFDYPPEHEWKRLIRRYR